MCKSTTNNLCIDIGGTNTRVALVNDSQIIELKTFLTNLDPIINFQQIKQVCDSWDYYAVGISTAGPITNNIYGKLPNLPTWEGFEITSKLFENDRLIVENDANCSSYFEHDTNLESTLFLTISTGIGAGFVVNNQLYIGSTGNGLEVHNYRTFDQVGVEELASGTGIYNRAKELGLDVINTKQVFESYDESAIANQVLNEAECTLSTLISNLIAILNPQQVVLGGSVIINNQWFFNQIKANVEQSVSVPTMINQARQPDYNTLLGVNKLLGRKYETK